MILGNRLRKYLKRRGTGGNQHPAGENRVDETVKEFLATDLPVVQYLNQRLVFDLLAVLKDGFSNFKTIETQASGSNISESKVAGGLGVGHSFALLSLGVAGTRKRNNENSHREITMEEHVHTPSSLFARLRSELKSRELVNEIANVDDLKAVTSSQFVEFRATLHRSQVIELIDAYLVLASWLSDGDENDPSGNPRPKRRNQRDSAKKPQPNSTLEIMETLKSLLSDGDATDLVATIENMRFVLTVEKPYFNDPTMNEVLNGEFRVFGKVTRALKDRSESIELFRRSAIGKFGAFGNVMEQITAEISGIDFDGGVTETKINGPALQIIPVAIFA